MWEWLATAVGEIARDREPSEQRGVYPGGLRRGKRAERSLRGGGEPGTSN